MTVLSTKVTALDQLPQPTIATYRAVGAQS